MGRLVNKLQQSGGRLSAKKQEIGEKPVDKRQAIGDFFKGELTGQPQKTNTLGSIFQNTFGSKGVLGMAQMPGQTIKTEATLNDQKMVSDSQSMLSALTAQMIVKKRSMTDPNMIMRMEKRIQDNLNQIQEMNGTLNELKGNELTQGQVIGTTGRALSTVAPYAFKGAESVLKIPQVGQGLSGAIKRITTRAVEGYLTGAGYGASGAIEEEKSLPEIRKTANQYGMNSAAFSGLFQTGVEGINGFASLLKNVGNKIQTSQIRPTNKELDDIYTPRGKQPIDMYKENVEKYKLYGSAKDVVTKSEEQLNELRAELKPNLTGKEKKINLFDIAKDVQERIIQNKTRNIGNSRAIQRVFDDSKEEFKYAYGSEMKGLDLIKSNTLKSSTGGLGAWEHGRLDPDASAKETVWDYWYKSLKEAIEVASGNAEEVARINRQMSEIIPIRNAALRSIPGQMKLTPIGLKEFIGGIAALSDPHAAALLAVNYLSKSGNFAEFLSNTSGAIGGKTINPAIQAGPAQGEIINSLRDRFK